MRWKKQLKIRRQRLKNLKISWHRKKSRWLRRRGLYKQGLWRKSWQRLKTMKSTWHRLQTLKISWNRKQKVRKISWHGFKSLKSSWHRKTSTWKRAKSNGKNRVNREKSNGKIILHSSWHRITTAGDSLYKNNTSPIPSKIHRWVSLCLFRQIAPTRLETKCTRNDNWVSKIQKLQCRRKFKIRVTKLKKTQSEFTSLATHDYTERQSQQRVVLTF